MSRAFATAIKAILAARSIPTMPILVELHGLSLKLTSWPKDIVFDGATYKGAKQFDHAFTMKLDGVGENLKFEAPSATLEISNMDAYFAGKFLLDQFRGTNVTITILYMDTTGAFQQLGWATTFTIDADRMDSFGGITLKLASEDVATGTEGPKRNTTEWGCQFILGGDDCRFRWVQGMAAVLQTCDHGYYTPNGCKAHFRDVIDPVTNLTAPQPRPYGAFLGVVDGALVGRG